ncbi:MAG: DUF5686 and carboxypeptidase regulatory-like domain-containing protein, partial [Lachnoclostridium sp.]|nr:DUF5686 and carboxypeptidase regulatory-like domain-containing protein [Lachnoclostridium sp.]
MRKFLLICSILFFFCYHVVSQNVKGKVLDLQGEPVIGSSVYIKENNQGMACNEYGEFQVSLSPGTYHFSFSCLGYETHSRSVVVEASGTNDMLVELKEKSFNLKEVVIDNSGEDPAYAIMREAIKKAPYYRSLVKGYVSEVYIKGSGKLIEIPKLMARIGGADEINMYKDKIFLQESFSTMHFYAPDRYEQKVEAFSSTIPNDLDPEDVMTFVSSSLYNPMMNRVISPLNEKSFSYYKFQYEGYNEKDGDIINKIKIIPKLKDAKLMSGYIYIAEDSWDVRHAELVSKDMGQTQTCEITYNDIRDKIFLPTSFRIHADIDIMGIKAFFDYLSSMKYKEIQINDSLIADARIKLKKEKKSLEIKRNDNYKVKTDSLSTSRDSLYWLQVRSVPLNKDELLSYVRKDSIQAFADSIEKKDINPKFGWGNILVGGRVKVDSAKFYINYGGLLSSFPEYNFVDGLWLGQSFELDIRRNKNSQLKIKPMIYWALKREQLVWNVDASFSYAPVKLGRLYASGGMLTEDYSGDKGMLRIENAFNSLFWGINNARFYEKKYFTLGNEFDIANGLHLNVQLEYAERTSLSNYTTYSFFGDKDDVKPNLPDYDKALHENDFRLAKYNVELQYTPEYYYRMIKGRKRYERSRFPTFNLAVEQGLSAGMDNASTYFRMDFGVSQTLSLGIFEKLNYSMALGKFFNGNDFNYIDYKHFNNANQLVTGKHLENSYVLLDYYRFSTNKNWIQAFLNYDNAYLALKRLPFLQGKPFSESLHAKFLNTP